MHFFLTLTRGKFLEIQGKRYLLHHIVLQVKKDLRELSEQSYQSNADFVTLEKFEIKFAEAQKLQISEDELNECLDALERLKFSIDKAIPIMLISWSKFSKLVM